VRSVLETQLPSALAGLLVVMALSFFRVVGSTGEKKPPGGCPAVSGDSLRCLCLDACLSGRRAVREPKVRKEVGAGKHGAQCITPRIIIVKRGSGALSTPRRPEFPDDGQT
jgi:hypothetical protein